MNKGVCYCLLASCVLVLTKGENQLGPRENADAAVNSEGGRAAREVTETREKQLKALWDYYYRTIENYRRLKNSWRDSVMKKQNITAPEEKMLDEDKKIIDEEKEESTDVSEEKLLDEDKKIIDEEKEKPTDAPKEKILDEDKEPMVKEKEESTDVPEAEMLDEDMKIADNEKKTSNATEEEMLEEDNKPMDKENKTPIDATEEEMLEGDKKPVHKEKETSKDAAEEKMPHGDKKIVDEEKEKPDNAPVEKILDGDKKPLDEEKEKSSNEDKDTFLDKLNSIRIKYPLEGKYYKNNEHVNWIIRNYDLHATGFRINVLSVALEECCDKLVIHTPECKSGTRIRSSEEGTFFIPGSILNITFTSDEAVSFFGFTIDVQATNVSRHVPCPGSKDLSLDENRRTVIIKHPERGTEYDNNERYSWVIRNKDPQALGFKVAVEKMEIHPSGDEIRMQGAACSYGPYTTKKDLTLRGKNMLIEWTSDKSGTDSGFIFNVTSLYEPENKDCYEYTCDDEGRCLRIHYDDQYSWQDSKVVCETEGARLAVIADEQINNLTSSLYDRDMKGPWIGMSVDSMGNMTWITGKSINDYELRKWSSEVSRVFEDEISGCGVFYSDEWGIDRCHASRPFICEKVQ